MVRLVNGLEALVSVREASKDLSISAIRPIGRSVTIGAIRPIGRSVTDGKIGEWKGGMAKSKGGLKRFVDRCYSSNRSIRHESCHSWMVGDKIG